MALPAQKKGQGEREIRAREPHGLPLIPQQLLSLKRQRRCGHWGGNCQNAERQEIHHIRVREPIEQPAARERHEGPAGAEPEQREADHHGGEVMPVNDREVAGQQHLVC
jgi:hypothetical protein